MLMDSCCSHSLFLTYICTIHIWHVDNFSYSYFNKVLPLLLLHHAIQLELPDGQGKKLKLLTKKKNI